MQCYTFKVCKVPLVSGVLGALYKLVVNNNNNQWLTCGIKIADFNLTLPSMVCAK